MADISSTMKIANVTAIGTALVAEKRIPKCSHATSLYKGKDMAGFGHYILGSVNGKRRVL